MKPLSPRAEQALKELLDLWSATLAEEIPPDMRDVLDRLERAERGRGK